MLAGEWHAAAELYETEDFHGIIPSFFADSPATAEVAYTADPSLARKDVDRMQRALFQPEILTPDEALKVCKRPRAGEAVFAYKLANLDALERPVPRQSRTAEPQQDTPGPSSKRPRLDVPSNSGRENLHTKKIFSFLEPFRVHILLHLAAAQTPAKYATRSSDIRVETTVEECGIGSKLVTAAYASSSWNSMMAALKCYEKFAALKAISMSWPLQIENVKHFINWAIFEKELSSSTVKTYVNSLGTIHRLKNLSDSSCKNFITRAMIRGAENLNFYDSDSPSQRNVMTLPILRILGHEICMSNWSKHSKSVVWAVSCTAFFGSFRLGELLSRDENSFNPFETLLWKDVSFLSDGSVKIHNKIPKTRKSGGETISLFSFDKFGCCPILALKKLHTLSNAEDDRPVFAFANGTFLTNKKLNEIIRMFLSKRLGSRASGYSCQSFRGALPSALATCPALDNDDSIKKWGRWHSAAFERYTRLSHLAKRAIFSKFVHALEHLK